MDTEEVWTALIAQIKSYPDIEASQIDAIFSRIQVEAVSTGFILLTASSPFIKEWVGTHYSKDIKQALFDLYGAEFHVQLEVDTTQQASSPSLVGPDVIPSAHEYEQDNQQDGSDVPLRSGAHDPQPIEVPNPSNDASAPARSLSALEEYQRELYNEHFAQERPRQGTSPAASHQKNVAPSTQNTHYQSSLNKEKTSEERSRSKNPLFSEAVSPSLTFENFVIGDSNNLAYQMAVDVAERPGNTALDLNPLFIYGKSGVGKTHLLCAIQNYIREQYPVMNVCYIDTMDLVNRYSDAAIEQSVDKFSFKNFESSFHEADVLLIDDIQKLQNAPGTLDVVFRLFNSMIARGKQMVFAADRAPKNIDLDERYVSRFNQGATIDIQPPNDETKRSIIKSYLKQLQQEEDFTFELEDDTIDYIVDNSSSNVREIKSAITGIVFAMKMNGGAPLPKFKVHELLDNHFSSASTTKITPQAIQKAVEDFYKVSHADLVSSKHAKRISLPRQVAIYLIREICGNTYKEIAKLFNKDHSTIMYSYNKISEYIKEDRDLREEIEAIREKIRINEY